MIVLVKVTIFISNYSNHYLKNMFTTKKNLELAQCCSIFTDVTSCHVYIKNPNFESKEFQLPKTQKSI